MKIQSEAYRHLIAKYNIPGPRYTSYPTVPFWEESTFSPRAWQDSVKKSFEESNAAEGISLYLHLPFCESLCTFCACHKKITKRHSEEDPYIEALLTEWEMYLSFLGEKPRVKELHLGGGTPTFFSPKNLHVLITRLLEKTDLVGEVEFSFEGHPNSTTKEHLQVLYDLGFRRVSFGVQDYDLKVQEAIHRIQPFEQVESVTALAREVGYESISHDLIFGLPFQTLAAMQKTIRQTQTLHPDRIAFYSYAHVPWIKGVGQRGFDEKDLPTAEEKRQLYEVGKQLFEEMGYAEIGMDHFSLKTDSLYKAAEQKKMHRNFMGYSSSKTQLMIGLGISSISDSWYGFAQNQKNIKQYYRSLERGELSVFRGHILNEEDLHMRKHILNLMCHLETTFTADNIDPNVLKDIRSRLQEMEADQLLCWEGEHKLKVTELGRSFVRNICMTFDLRMLRNKPETRIFSMTI